MKILFFINGRPTEAEQKMCDHMPGAVFRNKNAYKIKDFIESTDYVYGDIPKDYRHYPLYEMPSFANPEPPKTTKPVKGE